MSKFFFTPRNREIGDCSVGFCANKATIEVRLSPDADSFFEVCRGCAVKHYGRERAA